MAPSRSVVVMFFLTLSVGLAALAFPRLDGSAAGTITDADGPAADVLVRWQGSAVGTRTDSKGRFHLPGPARTRTLTAAKPGYLIASGTARQASLFLQPVPDDDHAGACWIEPSPDLTQPLNCANCHRAIFDEWASSAHGQSAVNPKFLSLFAGDAAASEGVPKTTWNLLEEYPIGSGVCATCHAPTLSSPALDYDIRQARGVDRHGVHCDFCHKIADAPTDKLGTRFGRDGYRLVRPAPESQLFFGPLGDAVRPGESFAYAPFYKESRYCASCHEGVIFGVHVYGTYSEWLDSPAARQGKQCQNCHMTPTGTMTNIAPGHGGVERDPRTLASHQTPGGTAAMLKQCVDVKAKIVRSGPDVVVTVTTIARNVGHQVPTGFIDRHLILVVDGRDDEDRRTPLVKGPTLPRRAGPALVDRPGWIFGKQHLDASGQPLPFWRDGADLIDTRLIPERADVRRFVFSAQATTVRLRVLYRRFWDEVAQSRNWRDNELILRDEILRVADGH